MKKNKDKGISVNERRQYQSGSQEMNFIVQQLVKNGNTKSDAIKMTQKHYNNVLKRYKEPWFIHPVKKAEIISSLSANESVNEAKLSDEELVKYALYIKKYKPGLWNQMKKNADMKQLIKKFKLEKKESVNEAGMELNKIKDAIKMFQKKIEKQGRVTNARDEEHLKNLIKLYIQMGGKGIKEGKLTEKSAISLDLWIKEFERLAKKNGMKPVDFVKKHISKRKGMDNEVVKNVLKHFQKNEGKLEEKVVALPSGIKADLDTLKGLTIFTLKGKPIKFDRQQLAMFLRAVGKHMGIK